MRSVFSIRPTPPKKDLKKLKEVRVWAPGGGGFTIASCLH